MKHNFFVYLFPALAFLFFLLAILFWFRSSLARRCLSKFGFAPDARMPYRFFGIIMLLGGVNFVVMVLPAPYRAVMLITLPLFLLLLFALLLFLLSALLRNK